uniref:sphingosine kinase n=1 Tax=Scylla olivacea TaxID=85551 RepID=A0A0P4WCE5_SCYOL
MAGCVDTFAWPLRGQFRQYKRGSKLYTVQLDESGVTVTSDGEKQVVKVTDLVGCQCQQEQQQQGNSAYFTLLAYPLTGGRKRTRLAQCFEVASKNTFKENLAVANAWRRAVYHAVRNHGTTKPQVDHSKKILLFINPNSGSGRALQTYKKQVSTLLAEAEVSHEVLVTERASHATDVVRTLDLTQYAGLVILSGDGLLYEVYNGLLARPDWDEAIQFPIGIIPGGSGNGLARSLAHWLREPYKANPVLVSTLNVVYGHLSPLDLVMTETAKGKRILSFLSIGFGLLSDIDIESERLRIIGESRFAVWAVARCANLRRYRATISFKRAVGAPVPAPLASSPMLQRSQTLQEGEGLPSTNARHLSHSHSMQLQESKKGEEEEACLDILPSLVKVEDGALEPVPEKAQEAQECEEQQQQDGAKSEVLLPGLDEPVPDDWETIEDEFVMVYCSQQTHITSDVLIAPQATPDDGYLWLMMLRRSCPKTTIAKLLLGLDGRHLRYPGVEMVAVEALRIVPGTSKGYLTVDGEVIPWTPIQSHVLHKRGCIMTR